MGKFQIELGYSLSDFKREIDLCVVVPQIYQTSNEATDDLGNYSVSAELLPSGEVVFNIYKFDDSIDNHIEFNPSGDRKKDCSDFFEGVKKFHAGQKVKVATVCYKDKESYRMTIIKEDSIGKGFLDAITDYEPYDKPFEQMYKELGTENESLPTKNGHNEYWLESLYYVCGEV